MSTIRYWQEMTTLEAQSLAQTDPVVILPLAAIEQHGPHLPLSTDLDIGMGLLESAFRVLPTDFPAWVLPPQAVGASREHLRFPGTLNLDSDLLGEIINQHGDTLAASGVKRLVLSNSHGGNRSILDTAGLRLREEHDMLVIKANYFMFPRPDTVDLPESEWRHGLHGGAVETSMMLHLHPDLVRTDKLQEKGHSLAETIEDTLRRVDADSDAAAFAWLAGDLNQSGVIGNASLAEANTGKRLVEYYGKVLAEVICDAQAFPLGWLTDR